MLVKGIHLVIILLLIMPVVIPTASPATSRVGNISAFSVPHYVNETDSTPTLFLDRTHFEMGDTVSISYGMRNTTDFYIAGYNVTLYINASNFQYVVLNGTTTDQLATLAIALFQDRSPLPSGSYGLVMNVSTINRGVLQAYVSFTITQNPFAALVFSLHQVGHSGFIVNRTEVIQLNIQNIGNGSAFNISVTIQQVTNPIGEITGDIFPLNNILILKGNATLSYAFEIVPTTFGIGRLDLLTSYTTAAGDNSIGTTGLDVVVLPTIIADITAGPLIKGNSSVFDVDVVNTESVGVNLLVSLSSDKILFRQSQYEIDSIIGSETVKFNGTILSTGQVRVTLSISFIDPDGGDSAIVLRYSSTFIIAEGTILPVSSNDKVNILVPFIYGAILTIVVLVGIFTVLYLRPKWRYKVLMRLIPEKMNVELGLSNNQIIVDGSNVAWDSPTPNHRANLNNLLAAIDHLKKIGFSNITVVVDAALRYQVEDKEKFDLASRDGLIKVLPAKVSGDLFILRLSNQTGALILTNDLFREFREEFPFIDTRRVPFSFLNGKFFLHPIAN